MKKPHLQIPNVLSYAQKCKTFGVALLLKIRSLPQICKNARQKYPPKQIYKNLKRKMKLRKVIKFVVKYIRKPLRKISDSWKAVIFSVCSFLFCYYIIGSYLSENIDTSEFKQKKDSAVALMAELIEREVDNHIWTPNLPPIFPAYVLDNMPNFQKGVISCVRDMVLSFKNLDLQNKNLSKAARLLKYPPDVWLMKQKSAFSLAPSSNSQYRKAKRELEEFTKHAQLFPSTYNLQKILASLSSHLNKNILKNEEQITEHYSAFNSSQADDVFYFNKGYAFALWQICDALGHEFKDALLSTDAYDSWTYLIGSLRHAAQYSPAIVRNAKSDSIFSPNHLIVQNYYLSRALTNIEKIENKLRETNASQN